MNKALLIKVGIGFVVVIFFGRFYWNFTHPATDKNVVNIGTMTAAELQGKPTTDEDRELARKKLEEHLTNGTVDTEARRRKMFSH